MKSQLDMRQVLDQVGSRVRELGWANVAQEDRDAANVDAFYGSVLNGGIDAPFFNSPYLGDMAEELAQSLTRVGATRAAALFRDAFAFFPDSRVPATLDARVDCLRKAMGVDPFETITRRFYTEAENEETVLRTFFAKHPNHFGFRNDET